ncbi:MAG TPA: hypothetical protein VMZ29_00045 [Candidatus Bathyarchaeia archaeon]|nr:hypothetical protein [Candidatus Bathyarchaeia archaeon]
MKRYTFIKKRESIPITTPIRVLEPKAGGIKLEYEIYATDNIHIRIGNRDIYIPYWKYNSELLVFFKLIKEYWDNNLVQLSKTHWNKKDPIYTKLWVILQSRNGNFNCYEDVVDINKDYKSLRIRTLCTMLEHHQIIKHLEKGNSKFSVPYVQIIF